MNNDLIWTDMEQHKYAGFCVEILFSEFAPNTFPQYVSFPEFLVSIYFLI